MASFYYFVCWRKKSHSFQQEGCVTHLSVPLALMGILCLLSGDKNTQDAQQTLLKNWTYLNQCEKELCSCYLRSKVTNSYLAVLGGEGWMKEKWGPGRSPVFSWQRASLVILLQNPPTFLHSTRVLTCFVATCIVLYEGQCPYLRYFFGWVCALRGSGCVKVAMTFIKAEAEWNMDVQEVN